MHSNDLAPEKPSQAKPARLLKRIGSTTFVVNVHFSNEKTETMEDKLLRLINREVEKDAW